MLAIQKFTEGGTMSTTKVSTQTPSQTNRSGNSKVGSLGIDERLSCNEIVKICDNEAKSRILGTLDYDK